MTTTVTEPTLERRWTVLIPTTGLPEVRELNDAGVLPHAGRLIGAEWIEVVHAEHWQLIIDEEGLLKEKPDNPIASYLYGSHLGSTPICGTAVVVRIVNDPETGEPDLAWLTCDEATRLHTQLLQMTGRVTV